MRATCTAVGLGLLLLFASSATAAQPPTRADYVQIKLGMTRAEVEAILGLPGEVKTSDGAAFLTWGELFRSVSVQVAEGRVISKWHSGLAEDADPGKVTRANYDRIEIGMTRAEVEAILGPGDEASVSRDTLILQWLVGLGTSESRWITVGFMDGTVAKKSQKGLE